MSAGLPTVAQSSDASIAPTRWNAAPGAWTGRDILALAVWSLAILLVFWKSVTLQGALFYFDVTEINFPYRAFLASEFKQGRFSRWMPGLYCGLPLFSESQAGYLHPLKLLYLALPAWKAFNLDTIGSVWLTGALAYGWLRRHVGPAGALVGAAVLGASGYTWAHLVHTSMINALASVPLVLWCLEWAWGRGGVRAMALGSLGLAAQVFAGHLQDALMMILLVGFYTAYRTSQEATWPDRRRTAALGGGLVVLAVLVAAVQWVPSKELIDRSPRAGGLSYEEATYGSWHPQLLPTLVVREAYGTRARDTDWMDGFYPYHEMNAFLGVVAVCLAVLGVAAWRDRWVLFWVLLGAAAVLLMLGKHTILYDLWYQLPVLGSGRIPVRYHLWLAVAVAALAAVGTDRLARTRGVALRYAALVMVVLVVASVPILAWSYIPVWTEMDRWPLKYHENRLVWLAQELAWGGGRALLFGLLGWMIAASASRASDDRVRRHWVALLPALVLAELMLAHRHDAVTVDPRYWTEPPPVAAVLKADPALQRVFGFGVKSAGEPGYVCEPIDFFEARASLAWSLAPVWGFRSASGLTPIVDRRIDRYAAAANDAGVRFDLESVSHVLTAAPVQAARFGEFTRVGRVFVLPNPTALPRIRLTSRIVYAQTPSDATVQLIRLRQAAREQVVIEDANRPLASDAPVDPDAVARLLRDEPERVEIETRSRVPAYLVLTDTYDPGWSAWVDGQPAPIVPAQIAFRAVLLPAGSHRVEFRYRPAGFDAGLAATLPALGVALGCLIWSRWSRREGRGDHEPARGGRIWLYGMLIWGGLILLSSLIAWSSQGRMAFQPRWWNSFHRFTWGAGIEAMTPPRPVDKSF